MRQRAGVIVIGSVDVRQQFRLAACVQALRRPIDGYEACVLRHEVVLEGDGDERGFDALRIAAVGEVIHQRLDLFAAPETGDSVAAAGGGKRQLLRPRIIADAAMQRDLRVRVVDAHGYDQRLAAVEVGDAFRPRLGDRVVAVDDDRRHHRRVEFCEQLGHPFLHLLHVADVGERAAAEARGVAHEVRIGGGADADGEEAALAEARVDEGEKLLLVADLAVGHEDHLADRARGRGWMFGHGQLQCAQHFRAAVGGDLLDERFGRCDRLRVGELAVAEQRARGGIEIDHIELVARFQIGEREEQRGFGLLHRCAFHRTGAVDDEDRLARQADR